MNSTVHFLSSEVENNTLKIESFEESMDAVDEFDERINSLNSTVDDLSWTVDEFDERIAENDAKIVKLRDEFYEFEYEFKYEFVLDLSEWQIDMEGRLDQAEIDIGGMVTIPNSHDLPLKHILCSELKGTTTTMPTTVTTKPPTNDCA